MLISGEAHRRALAGAKSRGSHSADVRATLALVSLKGIRPCCVVLSQDTAENFFCDRGIIRELESNFVIELPFVVLVRVNSQRNVAVLYFCLRWVALEMYETVWEEFLSQRPPLPSDLATSLPSLFLTKTSSLVSRFLLFVVVSNFASAEVRIGSLANAADVNSAKTTSAME